MFVSTKTKSNISHYMNIHFNENSDVRGRGTVVLRMIIHEDDREETRKKANKK